MISKFKILEYETAFKKAQSDVAKMAQMMKYDLETTDLYGGLALGDSTYSTEHGFAKSIEKYLKKTNNLKQIHVPNHIYDNNGKELYYKNHSNSTNINAGILDDGGYGLIDGRTLWFDGGYFDAGNPPKRFMISFDINGTDQGPNRYGYDLFSFILDVNGEFFPAGTKGINDTGLIYQHCDKATTENPSQSCSKTATNNCNGIGCAYQAANDINYFKKLNLK